MIPLTVSFFTKGSEDKARGCERAHVWRLHPGDLPALQPALPHPGRVDPEIFNEISTNPGLNIFFFVIFLVFAVSFFGYFEITLPAAG
jgi:hypothetical protein